MEILNGKAPYFEIKGGVVNTVLLSSIYEIEGFHLKAYHQFEAFSEEPWPYLEIDLTSAAVIARVVSTNSILLVEFKSTEGRRVELPAGKVSGKDSTVFHTGLREFDEETGGIIPIQNLKPLSVIHHKDGNGGIQFYTEVPKLKMGQYDQFGRGYLIPPEGTDMGRVICLITEPLNIFLDEGRTLLRHSHNKWAVDDALRLTLGMYISNSSSS